MTRLFGAELDPMAKGRFPGTEPVAVLDIGSNSVRLVVYERTARSLTPLYNEKAACALGRGVAKSGSLPRSGVEKALKAIKRFAMVIRLMGAGTVHILATSAVRDSGNGKGFADKVEAIMGHPVTVLTGPEEAHFAALGVISGIPDFVGVVGDLGGGSLELSNLSDRHDVGGETLPLGVIRLQDDSGRDPGKLGPIVKQRVSESEIVRNPVSKSFCAIGGTWRALAKVHQIIRNYPLHMVQNYEAKAADIIKLCDELVAAAKNDKPHPALASASSGRRPLLPYGAAVLSEVMKQGRFERVVFSALGVREGYIFGQLGEEEAATDPLRQAAEEMSVLRSRSPLHAYDLIAFTGRFMNATGTGETAAEARLREVACLLSDIGWRGHPDYRGEQSVDLVAYGSFIGVDHPGRAFLAEVLAVRYMGLKQKSVSRALLDLAGERENKRARALGALFRVAYPLSAAMPGVLPQAGFLVEDKTLVLTLPDDLAFLDADHLRGRVQQLAGATGFKSAEVRIR
ncbi:MAG TPA: Ppx/GppA phosphatase family protein [Devosiaceae bacterium]